MSIYTEEEEKVFAEVAAYEKEIQEYNAGVFAAVGASEAQIKRLLDYANITDKIQNVTEPKGHNQREKFGPFRGVWVDQTSSPMGETGDYSYSGFIYAKISKNNWLAIPFEC